MMTIPTAAVECFLLAFVLLLAFLLLLLMEYAKRLEIMCRKAAPKERSPLNADTVIVAPGEYVIVRKSDGAVIAWLPAPDNEQQTSIIYDGYELLTHEDTIEPTLRERLTVIKGGSPKDENHS